MIRQLIVNNVLHRPIRTIVSVIAVGVEVAPVSYTHLTLPTIYSV